MAVKVVWLYVSRAIETSQPLKNLFKDHNTFPLALWLHHSLCSGHTGQLPIFLCTSKFSYYGCYTGTLSPTTQFLHISAWFTTLLPSNLLKCHFLNEVYLTAPFKTCKSPYSLITHPLPLSCLFFYGKWLSDIHCIKALNQRSFCSSGDNWHYLET